MCFEVGGLWILVGCALRSGGLTCGADGSRARVGGFSPFEGISLYKRILPYIRDFPL